MKSIEMAAATGEITLRKIIIEPRKDYEAIFRAALTTDNNYNLSSTIPTDDNQYLQFFVKAIAKEIKAISASSEMPTFLAEKAKSPSFFFGVEPSTNKYKNVSLNILKPGISQKSYIESAFIVFQESLRAVRKGYLFETVVEPTTLFLYYRTIGSVPVYSGHIFVQRTEPNNLFFVSIYKSLFEKEAGLSSRILNDVEAYARELKVDFIVTVPLESMKKKLEASGFKFVESSVGDTTFYKPISKAAGANTRRTRRYKRRNTRRNRRI